MKYFYSYILYSPQSKKFFVSYSEDLKRDVQLHNDGHIDITKKGKPWNLIWYGAFRIEKSAINFNNFLNTSEGNSFMKKWLVPFRENEIPSVEDRPKNAKICPICEGSGKAANDVSFYRGNRYSKNVTICLTCKGRGWIDIVV